MICSDAYDSENAICESEDKCCSSDDFTESDSETSYEFNSKSCCEVCDVKIEEINKFVPLNKSASEFVRLSIEKSCFIDTPVNFSVSDPDHGSPVQSHKFILFSRLII